MNHSKNPRDGVRRRSGSSKKSAAQHSGKKPAARFHIPKGFEGAGKFTSRDAWELFYQPALKEKRRDEKRKNDRETKKATRERRAEFLAKVDTSSVTKKELRDVLRRKGMRNDTGKLQEKTRYRWFGLFKIQGTEAQVRKAAATAGSDPRRVKITQQTDGTWTAMYPRFFQHGTPTQAEGFLAGHVQQGITDFQRQGASKIEYLGAVWQAIPTKKGGK